MSNKIHAACSGTVIEPWKTETPTGGGKPYERFILQLDPDVKGERTWQGRKIVVKSWGNPQYNTQINIGDRVFVTGEVDASAFVGKKDGKPLSSISIASKTVSVEIRSKSIHDPEIQKNTSPTPPPVSEWSPGEPGDVPF